MSTMVLPMSPPKSLKRGYDDMVNEFHSLPDQTTQPPPSSSQDPPSSLPNTLHTHEAPSHSLPSLAPFPSTHTQSPTPAEGCAVPSSNTGDAAKKSKPTDEEREARRMEKEFKAQQRAAEKVKKEEEKIQKDKEKAAREEERLKKAEEKRQKDEEKRKAKEERDRLREEEKSKKDAEKLKKEEEKSKKERTQLRLNNFFVQGSAGSRSPTGSPRPSPAASRRGSLAVEDLEKDESATPTHPKVHVSDHDRAFPAFFVHANVNLAPTNRFARDEAAMSHAQATIDGGLKTSPGLTYTHGDLCTSIHDLIHLPPRKRARIHPPLLRVKDIVSRADGVAQNPVELTGLQPTNPLDQLRSIPVKFLKFREDVRPPYMGTYTKVTDPKEARRLARGPFSRSMNDVNYDYDSEAEWEDPGEGEELLSEGEEELEEEDEDDMEGFLDDEDATDARNIKRRPLLGDLEPACTGICWAGAEDGPDLSSHRIDMLTEKPSFPIDPYSSTYWHQPTPQKSMDPPRIPLHPIAGATNTLFASLANKNNASHVLANPSVKQPKKLIPADLLDDFKSAVKDSDLTKIGLVEQLKKKFPKQNKDTLKDSLDAIAERKGEKLAEKKWVLRSGV